MTSPFRDFFSGHADIYAKYRPQYPPELFEALRAVCRQHRLVWDCATGNGQAAVSLARVFDAVVATDASAAQIAQATPSEKVSYAVAPADRSGLAPHSVDLVTVAQAVHWFSNDSFFDEVQRVLAPGGCLAVWGYAFFRTGDEALDAIVRDVAHGALGPYWQPEPKRLWNGYADLPFPFETVVMPAFEMRVSWNLPCLLGHLESWSSTQAYVRAHGVSPWTGALSELEAAWGDAQEHKILSAPLSLRVGRPFTS